MSIKDLYIRNSIRSKLLFPNNTILSYFFFIMFFILNLYFLNPAVIARISISTAELVLLTGTQTNEANAEIETQPVTVETKIKKCST